MPQIPRLPIIPRNSVPSWWTLPTKHTVHQSWWCGYTSIQTLHRSIQGGSERARERERKTDRDRQRERETETDRERERDGERERESNLAKAVVGGARERLRR